MAGVGFVWVFGSVGGEVGAIGGVVSRVGGEYDEVCWQRSVSWSRVWTCKIYALLACLGGAFRRLVSGGEDLWFGVL
jgi:hypothetical protein